jgi:DNA-binding NarL/FixJ family response regulator
MDQKKQDEKITCYLVDDEPDAIDRLEILLEKINPVQIIGKETNPDKAIEAIVEKKPELLFLDIVMGGKTGFEVIETLREKGHNPCFIFVTGHNNYSISAIKKSAFDYLLKPVDINELKDTIRRYESARLLRSYPNSDSKIHFDQLSEREKEILPYLAEGKTSQEIAEILHLSKNTIDTHRRNILEKTGLKSTNELIRAYLRPYH